MRTESEMTELDDLFAEARRTGPDASEAFMARVLADALAEQPEPARVVTTRQAPAPQRTGLFDWLAGVFGGGGVLAGLGAVAAAGLLVGYVQPAPVTAVAGVFLTGASIETVELIPNLSGLVEAE